MQYHSLLQELRKFFVLEPVSKLISGGRLRWFGHVEREDEADWVKQYMMMELD